MQSLSQSPRGLFIAFEKQPFQQTCVIVKMGQQDNRECSLSPGTMPASGGSGRFAYTHSHTPQIPTPLQQRVCTHQLTSPKTPLPNFPGRALPSSLPLGVHPPSSLMPTTCIVCVGATQSIAAKKGTPGARAQSPGLTAVAKRQRMPSWNRD